MPSLFRRKSADLVEDQVEELAEPAEPVRPRGYTPKKGEATRKRPVANRRIAEAVPKDPKAARALNRQRQAEERQERRAGMMNGDDRYLTLRDKGPVRRYVRDVVDSRRNVGSIFFLGTIAVLALTVVPNLQVQVFGNLLFLVMVLAIMVDGVLLARRIKQGVTAKFPKHNERLSQLYFYAIMRSVSFRRMRIPKPQVQPGDKV